MRYIDGMPAGKPPYFDSVEEMQEKISLYFDQCLENKDRPTITGLALFLGFCSRQSFYDYEAKPEFSYTVKRARLTIENEYEKRIGEGAGYIFALKNFGWTDKQDLKLSGDSDNPIAISRIERVIVKHG